ncbi:MAG: ATP-binding protein [Terracidiphilus sp.]|jgi:signal transduction histidine kinase
MISSSELRRVAAFSDLPEEHIEWFLIHAQEVLLHAGETFVRQGDPADWMFIFLEGLFQWKGEFGGDTVSLPAQAGDISGTFPFSRMKRFSVSGQALTDGRLIRFPAACFAELTQRSPELTARLVAAMSDRIREGTRIEQQRDRLVSLGRLSAGFAHEFNNPASAAKRASDQMREALKKLQSANSELWRHPLNDSDKARIEEVEASLVQSESSHLDGIALGDLEEKLDSILKTYGHADSWELSAALAKCNMSSETLTSLLMVLDRVTVRAALVRIAASAELSILLSAIERSTARISNLVRTVKEYTYMDQAPIQNVDVARSLETTLGALVHILRPGIRVQRAYQTIPLLVNTVGTQLNQVWTNIIENAVEAMAGQGELRVRTFREEHYVVVEIGDTGPGIPAEIRPYIFDPFFTTKDVGAGTGLGLNTVQTIVRKLGGSIHVISTPGDTRFQVWLPWGQTLAEPGARLDTEVAGESVEI